jgi:hypothetical protein
MPNKQLSTIQLNPSSTHKFSTSRCPLNSSISSTNSPTTARLTNNSKLTLSNNSTLQGTLKCESVKYSVV